MGVSTGFGSITEHPRQPPRPHRQQHFGVRPGAWVRWLPCTISLHLCKAQGTVTHFPILETKKTRLFSSGRLKTCQGDCIVLAGKGNLQTYCDSLHCLAKGTDCSAGKRGNGRLWRMSAWLTLWPLGAPSGCTKLRLPLLLSRPPRAEKPTKYLSHCGLFILRTSP